MEAVTVRIVFWWRWDDYIVHSAVIVLDVHTAEYVNSAYSTA